MPCTEPLLIHTNGSATCAVPGCLDRLTLEEAVGQHRQVVNCRAALGARCPLCHPRARRDLVATTAVVGERAQPDAMCPGAVVIHADLSFECSEPDCPTGLSRGVWLAHHAVFLSCSRPGYRSDCPLCSASD